MPPLDAFSLRVGRQCGEQSPARERVRALIIDCGGRGIPEARFCELASTQRNRIGSILIAITSLPPAVSRRGNLTVPSRLSSKTASASIEPLHELK